MSAFVFNAAKGRVTDFADRVFEEVHSLIAIVLKSSGLEADAGLKDRDTLAEILANNNEATNTGYSRLVLSDVTLDCNDTDDYFGVDISDVTWPTVQATGGAWGKLILCWAGADGLSTSADSIIPMTAHDFVVTPNGSNLTAQVHPTGFFRAQRGSGEAEPLFVFNGAKGNVVGLYNRVNLSDPSSSAFVIVALKANGLEPDDVLQDYDNLADILASTNDEATNSGYARKVLTGDDLSAPGPDDTNNRYDVDIPDQTWTSVAAAGGEWGKLLVCYDPDSTGGTDSDIIPLTAHPFVKLPTGANIVAQIAATGFFRAAEPA